MKLHSTLLLLLLAGIALTILASSPADASLCQTIRVLTGYPHSVSPNRNVSVTTTVAGSCTSDGEDYFAVRVDLADNVSDTILSSNSTPIGYNANNFSVAVQNTATSPKNNQTWTINVSTYLVEAGGTSGKYLLNSTDIAIQVGGSPLPEFQPAPLLILVLAAIGLVSPRLKKAQQLARR